MKQEWEIKGTSLHRADIRARLKMDESQLPDSVLTDAFMEKVVMFMNKTFIHEGFWNSLDTALENAQEHFGLNIKEGVIA